MDTLDIFHYTSFILLLIMFIKVIMGFAYFDLSRFYKEGWGYYIAYSNWMDEKP